MLDTIITSVLSVLIFMGAYLYDRRHGEAAQLAEEVDDLREKLKTAEDERDGWKDTAESTDKLLRAAVERADRLSAMNQGLTEDLAALKAYNPEAVEERLKKIREIRAEEEKGALEDKLRETIAWSMLNAQLNVINQYRPPSPTLEQMVCAQSYQNPWGLL